MLLRFFSGIYPPKYPLKSGDNLHYPRLKTTLCRENLSLAGCSAAEPASVSVQHLQISTLITIFTNCRKKQPFTLANFNFDNYIYKLSKKAAIYHSFNDMANAKLSNGWFYR
jgi:hypothetical protein